MSREILHIYGPLSIQWYGVMILAGLSIFLWRALKHPLRKRYLTKQQFSNLVTHGVLAGIIGGRVLNFISEPENYTHFLDIFKIWEGGFSILGTIAAIAIYIPWCLYQQKIPIMPILDLMSLYAPLFQAIARIGCFFAGCCHGVATGASWGILCALPETPELIGIKVHPTQLYSAIALLCVFLVLRFLIAPRARYQGQIGGWYLILSGLERFVLDFWRAYRRIPLAGWEISLYQLLALCVCAIGIFILLFCSYVKPKAYEHF